MYLHLGLLCHHIAWLKWKVVLDRKSGDEIGYQVGCMELNGQEHNVQSIWKKRVARYSAKNRSFTTGVRMRVRRGIERMWDNIVSICESESKRYKCYYMSMDEDEGKGRKEMTVYVLSYILLFTNTSSTFLILSRRHTGERSFSIILEVWGLSCIHCLLVVCSLIIITYLLDS